MAGGASGAAALRGDRTARGAAVLGFAPAPAAPRGGRGGPGGRPPVVIELSARCVRAGHAGQPMPPHLVPCGPALSSSAPIPSPQAPAADWYRYYSPLIREALAYVLEADAQAFASGTFARPPSSSASPSFPPPSSSASDGGRRSRRVLVAYHGTPGGLGRSQREALHALLAGELGFPALSFRPAMALSFFALGRAVPHGMVVYASSVPVTRDNRPTKTTMMVEGHCMAFSHHRPLEFTYQATGCPPPFEGNDGGDDEEEEEDGADTLGRSWDRSWRRRLLDPASPHGLAACVVECLRACPIDAQAPVASHLLFCGDVFAADECALQRLVARQVRDALAGEGGAPAEPAPSADLPDAADADAAHRYTSYRRRNGGAAGGPSPLLHDSVGVVRVPGARCEAVPWLGASLWAGHWHSVHPDSPAFGWESAAATDGGGTSDAPW